MACGPLTLKNLRGMWQGGPVHEYGLLDMLCQIMDGPLGVSFYAPEVEMNHLYLSIASDTVLLGV